MELQALAALDGLIVQDLSPAQKATIRLHVGHFGPHPRWDHSPAHSCIDPEQVVDVEVYGQVFEPQDPVDPLYYQLHRFLLSRHVQDLKRCPTCGHYFFDLTTRTKVYCRDACRGKQTPAEAKRKPVRKWRAGETEKDLAEVRAAVQQVRDRGAATSCSKRSGRSSESPRSLGNKTNNASAIVASSGS
jgi:hypothetical protein